MRFVSEGDDLTVDISGETLPVRLRRNARAKKMILRVDGVNGDIKLTSPTYVSLSALRAFLREHSGWVERERAKLNVQGPLGSRRYNPLHGAIAHS